MTDEESKETGQITKGLRHESVQAGPMTAPGNGGIGEATDTVTDVYVLETAILRKGLTAEDL